MVNGKDHIKELFHDGLSQQEVPVNEALWKGIAQQLPASGIVVAKTGMSLLTKGIIAASTLTVLTVGGVLFFSDAPSTERPMSSALTESKVEHPEEYNKQANDQSQENTLVKSDRANTQTSLELGAGDPVEEVLPIKSENKQIDSYQHTSGPVSWTSVAPIEQKVHSSTPASLVRRIPESTSEEQLTEEVVVFKDTKAEQKEVVGKISRLPNVISPNGDGINDYLFLETEQLKEFAITIMNERNEVIFTSADPQFKWFGTDAQGNKLAKGRYFYFVTAVDEHNHKINKYSTLELR